jgi:hypothetical protein
MYAAECFVFLQAETSQEVSAMQETRRLEEQQIEMLMKSMAHVAQQEVMCRQITSARVLLAAACDSWYSRQTVVWTVCG